MKDQIGIIGNPARYQDMRAELIRLIHATLSAPVEAGSTIAQTTLLGTQLNTAARILDGSLQVSEIRLTNAE